MLALRSVWYTGSVSCSRQQNGYFFYYACILRGKVFGSCLTRIPPSGPYSSCNIRPQIVRQTGHVCIPKNPGKFCSLCMPLQILLATGEGNLVYLEIAEGQIAEKGHLKLAADISCLSINPLDQGKQNSPLAAVGTWANTVYLFQLPGLTGLNEQALGGDVIPRSLLFASFEGVNFLLIALGNLLTSLGLSSTEELDKQANKLIH